MAYPIVLLSSWLVRTIADNVDSLATYSNNIVAKAFVTYESPGVCNISWTPLLRVFNYIKTTKQGEISAVLHDSTHKILAVFSRECITKFEARYSQRLTFHTVHSLIIVRKCNLRFATASFLRESFGNIGSLNAAPGTEIVYLEVLEIELFHRDQILVEATHENRLRFVYGHEEYQEKFGKTEPKEQPDEIDSDGELWAEMELRRGI